MTKIDNPEDDTDDKDTIQTPLWNKLIEAVATYIKEELLKSPSTLTALRILMKTETKQQADTINEQLDRLLEPQHLEDTLVDHEVAI